MTYSINQFGFIIRDSDGAIIPVDTMNMDYVDYQLWVAAGNTATPYTAPSPTWSDVQVQAKAQLDDSDTSMHRITEAVTLGLSTLTTPDVVTFIQWRRALRAIVHTASGDPTIALPAKPPYPAHT